MSVNQDFNIKETIIRLAHFDPVYTDDYGCKILDYLILDALSSFGELLVSTSLEVKDYIKKCYKLNFEEAEIKESCRRLSSKGMVEYIEKKKEERPILKIKSEYQEKIKKNVSDTKELELEVLEKWKDEICEKYYEFQIVIDNIEKIINNLQLFTKKMFITHGIECVSLLYPEDNKSKQWIKNNKGSILECLEKIDPFVDSVLKIEIPNFFKNADKKRKEYINILLNSSFIWHLVQVDEKCSKLFKKITKGQKLYLDNNILYCLVGLDGQYLLQSTHTMLNIANSLGYELWVTTKTIDEFHNSLNWHMKESKQFPPVPSYLVRIAIENLDEDSFLTSYWREFVNNRISIEEFVTEKSHIEELLEGLEIKITNKFRKDIEESDEFNIEISKLRTFCSDDTSDYIIEHDAFHRIFINKIRKGKKYIFTNATAWFLTQDRKLPAYDRVARKGKDSLPFCLTSDQWVQVNRPFLVRTDNQNDYNESYHYLITQPFISQILSSFSLSKVYNEILRKISRYKSMNQELAFKIVVDKSFIIATASEEDERKREELIENEFVELANKLESDNILLKKRIKNIEKTTEGLQKDIKNNKEKMKELDEILEIERKKREKKEEELDESNIARVTYREQIDTLKNKLSNIIKWGIFGCFLIPISLMIWLQPLIFNFDFLDNHNKNFPIRILFNIIIALVLLLIPVKKQIKRQWLIWLGLIITCLIALLGFAFS